MLRPALVGIVLGDSLYIRRGTLPRGSQTIACGGRFVFVAIPGAASTILIYPHFSSTEIELIGGNKTSYIDYTKEANSVDVTFTNTASSGRYFIIDLFNL